MFVSEHFLHTTHSKLGKIVPPEVRPLPNPVRYSYWLIAASCFLFPELSPVLGVRSG